MNRRQFIQLSLTTSLAVWLNACRPRQIDVSPAANTTYPPAVSPTVAVTATAASTPTSVSVSIPDTAARHITSAIVHQEYLLYISLPSTPVGEPEMRFPVLYLLDGNATFRMAASTARWLENSDNLRKLIIVGIGYPSDTSSDNKNWRGRDFTPSYVAPPSGYLSEGFPTMSGGAANFLRFIREELKPVIDAEYKTDPQDAALYGHSLGGLFCLYSLFHHDGTFKRTIAASPSIWWDNQIVLKDEASYASANSDLPVTLFMGAGENEGSLVTDMQALAVTLQGRNYPGLKLSTAVFDGENHLTVVPALLSKGLRAVYPP